MNYSKFKFTAAVDWVEVCVQFQNPTSFQSIRPDFDFIKCAIPLDGAGNGTGRTFSIRFQDVKSWQDLQEKLDRLQTYRQSGNPKGRPFAATPTITGVEVSFDAYSTSATVDELAELTTNFYWFASRLASNNHRLVNRLPKNMDATDPPAKEDRIYTIKREWSRSRVLKCIKDGFTIYIGSNATDPISQRIYLKRTDSGGLALPQKKWRARTEVTLQGAELPFRTIEEASAYNFGGRDGLSREWFNFRKPKPAAPNSLGAALSDRHRPGAMLAGDGEGKIKVRRGPNRSPKKYATGSRADTDLNDGARDALRRLSRRMSKGFVPASDGVAEIRVFSAPKGRVNTGLVCILLITTLSLYIPHQTQDINSLSLTFDLDPRAASP